MINLTSPCCGVTAKYADNASAQYGCAGCGSGFTLEQAKAATDAAAKEAAEAKEAADKAAADAANGSAPPPAPDVQR
jgi:hypothetical protein